MIRRGGGGGYNKYRGGNRNNFQSGERNDRYTYINNGKP